MDRVSDWSFLVFIKGSYISIITPKPIKYYEVTKDGIFHFYDSSSKRRKLLISIPRENIGYIKSMPNN